MIGCMDGRLDGGDVLLVNCFNSADIKLSIVSSHRTLSSSHYHLDNHLDHYHIGTSLLEGTIYEGDWVRGVRHGVDKLSFSDGMIVLWTIFIHLLICIHSYIRTYIHTYIYPSTHLLVYTYIHTYIHTYIYSSIHPLQGVSTEATFRVTRCMEKASSLARTVPSMTVTGKPTCGKAWVQRSTAMAGAYDVAMMMMS